MTKKNKDKKEVVLSKEVHQLSKGLAVEVKRSRMEPQYDLAALAGQIAQHYRNIEAFKDGIKQEEEKIERVQEIIKNLGNFNDGQQK